MLYEDFKKKAMITIPSESQLAEALLDEQLQLIPGISGIINIFDEIIDSFGDYMDAASAVIQGFYNRLSGMDIREFLNFMGFNGDEINYMIQTIQQEFNIGAGDLVGLSGDLLYDILDWAFNYSEGSDVGENYIQQYMTTDSDGNGIPDIWEGSRLQGLKDALYHLALNNFELDSLILMGEESWFNLLYGSLDATPDLEPWYDGAIISKLLDDLGKYLTEMYYAYKMAKENGDQELADNLADEMWARATQLLIEETGEFIAIEAAPGIVGALLAVKLGLVTVNSVSAFFILATKVAAWIAGGLIAGLGALELIAAFEGEGGLGQLLHQTYGDSQFPVDNPADEGWILLPVGPGQDPVWLYFGGSDGSPIGDINPILEFINENWDTWTGFFDGTSEQSENGQLQAGLWDIIGGPASDNQGLVLTPPWGPTWWQNNTENGFYYSLGVPPWYYDTGYGGVEDWPEGFDPNERSHWQQYYGINAPPGWDWNDQSTWGPVDPNYPDYGWVWDSENRQWIDSEGLTDTTEDAIRYGERAWRYNPATGEYELFIRETTQDDWTATGEIWQGDNPPDVEDDGGDEGDGPGGPGGEGGGDEEDGDKEGQTPTAVRALKPGSNIPDSTRFLELPGGYQRQPGGRVISPINPNITLGRGR